MARNQHRQTRSVLRAGRGLVRAAKPEQGEAAEGLPGGVDVPDERMTPHPLPAPSVREQPADLAHPAPPQRAAGSAAPEVDFGALSVVSTIEQQLKTYFTAMSARADATQRATENAQDEMARHFQRQIDSLRNQLANVEMTPPTPEITPELRAQLRTDLEAELRVELTQRLREELRAELLHSLHDELRAQLQLELRHEALEEREKIGLRLNQFTAHASAMAQQLADTSSGLNQRINEVGRALEGQIDERSVELRRALDEVAEAGRAAATEQVTLVSRKVDENEQRMIDRMLAMEERVNEHAGTRIADLDANFGRMSRGVDEAIAAMSHRVAELHSEQLGFTEQVDELKEAVAKVDQDALDRLAEQMSSAVGESMLVRIEMERLAASTAEQMDHVNVRIVELATLVAESTMDVSTAVQLERLEEIERSLAELDPDLFVKKSEIDGTGVRVAAPTPVPSPHTDAGELALGDDLFEALLAKPPSDAPRHEPKVLGFGEVQDVIAESAHVEQIVQQAAPQPVVPPAVPQIVAPIPTVVAPAAAGEPAPDAATAQRDPATAEEAGEAPLDAMPDLVWQDPDSSTGEQQAVSHPLRRKSDHGLPSTAALHPLRRSTDRKPSNGTAPEVQQPSRRRSDQPRAAQQPVPPPALDPDVSDDELFKPFLPSTQQPDDQHTSDTLSSW